MSQKRRLEYDSFGPVEVAEEALFGAQTQRASVNFRFSEWRLPRPFLRALGLIKAAAAWANGELGLLDHEMAAAIRTAASEIECGMHDSHFVVDVFQTGSGTSTNMNANEVIATLAGRRLGRAVHPNDHVNLGQSSNDVIPTAIHVSAASEVTTSLMPALGRLSDELTRLAVEHDSEVKTGRTHRMDAVPIRLGQEFSGWAHQVDEGRDRLQSSIPRLMRLAIGGTAVGTGLNTDPAFGRIVAARLAADTGLPFLPSANFFAAISSQDTALELSGGLRTLATSLWKIADDLCWMNSGPASGLGEITLPALQPGSSIMPGKVNPVIPEAVAMACAQVVGSDHVIALAARSGNFQLNTMLPLVAYQLALQIRLLTQSAHALAGKALRGMVVHKERMRMAVAQSPALVTALARRIGYDQAAAIVKRAQSDGCSILDAAAEMTDLERDELGRLLDPARLTHGGFS